jgi:hypothetical protein
MRKAIILILLSTAALALAAPGMQPEPGDALGGDKQPATVDRVYDVRDYLYRAQDYPQTPAAPTSRPAINATQKDLGEIMREQEAQSSPRQAQIDDLVRLITSSVYPDTWRDAGGSTGSITELGGRLYVTTTPEAHAQIEKIIAEATAGANRSVHISATWLLLTEAELSALREPAFANDHAAIRLSESALQKATPVAHAELVCLDGQTVHITAQHGRITLQVRPQVTSTNDQVFLDVMNSVGDVEQLGTTARIRLGDDVVLGGITAGQSDKDSPKQLYLVVRADVVEDKK